MLGGKKWIVGSHFGDTSILANFARFFSSLGPDGQPGEKFLGIFFYFAIAFRLVCPLGSWVPVPVSLSVLQSVMFVLPGAYVFLLFYFSCFVFVARSFLPLPPPPVVSSVYFLFALCRPVCPLLLSCVRFFLSLSSLSASACLFGCLSVCLLVRFFFFFFSAVGAELRPWASFSFYLSFCLPLFIFSFFSFFFSFPSFSLFLFFSLFSLAILSFPRFSMISHFCLFTP